MCLYRSQFLTYLLYNILSCEPSRIFRDSPGNFSCPGSQARCPGNAKCCYCSDQARCIVAGDCCRKHNASYILAPICTLSYTGIEALRVTSLIAFHRTSAIFEGNVCTVPLLKHCIMVLTCCVVDCKNHGGREKFLFLITSVIRVR